jgi:hypothetical protein
MSLLPWYPETARMGVGLDKNGGEITMSCFLRAGRPTNLFYEGQEKHQLTQAKVSTWYNELNPPHSNPKQQAKIAQKAWLDHPSNRTSLVAGRPVPADSLHFGKRAGSPHGDDRPAKKTETDTSSNQFDLELLFNTNAINPTVKETEEIASAVATRLGLKEQPPHELITRMIEFKQLIVDVGYGALDSP